jgi:hypothetical protein
MVRWSWALALPLLGCSSILGITDFEVAGDGGTGDGSAEDGSGTDAGNQWCSGRPGWVVCFEAAPSAPVTVPAVTFDTSTSSMCAPGRWQSTGHPDACFVVGTSVTFGDNGAMAVGDRPLVIVASDTIRIISSLDVSSRATSGGAGAGVGCPMASPAGTNGIGGGGGGGGGTFGTQGGRGGDGASGAPGAAAPVPGSTPAHLRGGCAGGAGGDGNEVGGSRGNGGGALYLIAGNRITIDGYVNASGAGGGGGRTAAGGGGGGSGGLIVLHAPVITGNGTILANGGGGGGGGSTQLPGMAGSDPSPSSPLASAPGGLGGTTSGGRGGLGGAGNTTGGNGASGVTGGTLGGGGGGGGVGYVISNQALSGLTVSPTPVP